MNADDDLVNEWSGRQNQSNVEKRTHTYSSGQPFYRIAILMSPSNMYFYFNTKQHPVQKIKMKMKFIRRKKSARSVSSCVNVSVLRFARRAKRKVTTNIRYENGNLISP